MKISREIWNRWLETMCEYYEHTDPFDKEGLMTDTMRMMSFPLRVFRVLCSCAYLGREDLFIGGILTEDILKITGWEMPCKANDEQIKKDEIMSKKIEQKCGKYIDKKLISKLIKEQNLALPVEWRTFYIMYVPKAAFTTGELSFMENNPCWLLSLVDNPDKQKTKAP
ncbi:hypothetical protein [Mediterraneibacter agrestimuris]|uniref:hypothetical protein n=1 Tax=Mediterraneibacter agrestimuris TaxID=2941333 RepID=UPI00203D159A|nr:hypothetical protein [Mediterraneibacter agrestimuris]